MTDTRLDTKNKTETNKKTKNPLSESMESQNSQFPPIPVLRQSLQSGASFPPRERGFATVF